MYSQFMMHGQKNIKLYYLQCIALPRSPQPSTFPYLGSDSSSSRPSNSFI